MLQRSSRGRFSSSRPREARRGKRCHKGGICPEAKGRSRPADVHCRQVNESWVGHGWPNGACVFRSQDGGQVGSSKQTPITEGCGYLSVLFRIPNRSDRRRRLYEEREVEKVVGRGPVSHGDGETTVRTDTGHGVRQRMTAGRTSSQSAVG